MTSIARGRNLLDRLRHGRPSFSDGGLAINLSFVLHERSTSKAVQSAVSASHNHAQRKNTTNELVVDGNVGTVVDCWLVPSVGSPENIAIALNDAGFLSPTICWIDGGHEPTTTVPFFRADAKLTLPDAESSTVGVAALVTRPTGRSHQLILRGPFAWPAATQDAIRALEAIIQAHVQQWTPGTQLWPAPSEALLPDEIR